MSDIEPKKSNEAVEKLQEVENESKDAIKISNDKKVGLKTSGSKLGFPVILSVVFAVVAMGTVIFSPSIVVSVINRIIRSKDLPQEEMEYFINQPMDDLKFSIPLYLQSEDFVLPDLVEATRIQCDQRKEHEFKVVPQWELVFENGKYSENPPVNTSRFAEDAFYTKVEITDMTAIYVDPIKGFGTLLSTPDAVGSNDLPYFMTQMLVDHCYKDEFSRMSLSNFISVRKEGDIKSSYMYKKDYDVDKEIRLDNIRKHASFSNSTLNLEFVMIGLYDWDISEAVDNYFRPYIDLLKNFGDITLETLAYQCEEDETKNELKYINEDIPIELSDLKHIASFVEFADEYVINSEHVNNTLRFLFYPYGNSDIIYNKTIGEKPLYNPSVNLDIPLGSWGSIYFAHDGERGAPVDQRVKKYHSTSIKDAMDAYFAYILNLYDFPSPLMAPKFRLQAYKRIQITRNFANLSHLLYIINDNIVSGDKWLTPFVTGKVLEAFDLRAKALKACEEFDLNLCYQYSNDMIDTVFEADFF